MKNRNQVLKGDRMENMILMERRRREVELMDSAGIDALLLLKPQNRRYILGYGRSKDLLAHDMTNILQSFSFSTEVCFTSLNDTKQLEKDLKGIGGQVE